MRSLGLIALEEVRQGRDGRSGRSARGRTWRGPCAAWSALNARSTLIGRSLADYSSGFPAPAGRQGARALVQSVVPQIGAATRYAWAAATGHSTTRSLETVAGRVLRPA